ncbi:MAG: matrixin family metalloprotease [Gemmatimonas sp.]|nr:matrixin family metalloprotease [Gemmatimonas sp.]
MPVKLAETLLACCVVGLACFIGGQTLGARQAVLDEAGGTIVGKPTRAIARPSGDPRPGSSARGLRNRTGNGTGNGSSVGGDADMGHVEEILVTAAERRDRRRDLDDVRRRLTVGASGTYLDELLTARDSAIARWPDRVARPLRVFVREAVALEGWNPDFAPAVRDAFATWRQAGIPVHFTFVRDSASADITVHFVDRFANGISGKTVWSRDGGHWLISSDIQLAVSHPNGGTVTAPQMRAIALHEVGHLLGLDHTTSADNIMSARVRVRELSDADKATVRLVYSVPAGSLKR